MVVLSGELTKPSAYYDADYVVIGGGLGGIAAAISLCSFARTVILVEETDRAAGCFALQDTLLLNENRFIEKSGSSIAYQTFRSRIREWYEKQNLNPPKMSGKIFKPSLDFSSENFCFETQAALDVIEDMLEKNIERGRLTVLRRHKAAKVITFNGRVTSLLTIDMDNMVCDQITGWMFIDATRSGYILPLAGVECVNGRESAIATGEPHAPDFADTLLENNFFWYTDTKPHDDSDKYMECEVFPLTTDMPERKTNHIEVMSEPCRIKALTTIVEQDISADCQKGLRSRFFKNSVGIGYYPIILNIEREENSVPMIIKTKPFQIPLGALIPKGFTNLLAGGVTLGVSYIAAGAYRAPSIEWAVGEAAGVVAAYCAGNKINTHTLVQNPDHVKRLQNLLVKRKGIPIYWYDDITPMDSDFEEAQLNPFNVPGYNDFQTTLHYHE